MKGRKDPINLGRLSGPVPGLRRPLQQSRRDPGNAQRADDLGIRQLTSAVPTM